ncbi:deoxyguanosinetriphosphate triphosphohydrolase [Actinocorallia sp. A-T 12471]|uniref:deoxyguanosinetriphosphate triphosphohydrolase n=1 Tax=Actinocorallia sp. A-T 12471 TaxID=3089813 RepID=UPI0029CDC371|nr:deoxyguanosinetriphosphate triphosphohydrolase [Actinocorallia sp. A-T 12471]MDX6744683.1 deoxyguanosinetriphosphate triphosphohydrolase [Actinocorallia sp. A-T 12471]
MNGYTSSDIERWAPEVPKRRDRTAFERDRARVLHSAALRRLSSKTQVGDPGSNDFQRTRLTHSLECGQVGRELGKSLGCDPDLVETACLAHDLGHPPFGHNGEKALDVFASACGGFEGNAQSLRLLTRLEHKSFAADGRSVGLNLTRASLDATMKYPWRRRDNPTKYGVYDDDLEVALWVRSEAPEGRSCFEAQVMDWSDDVAYSVHDLEDALVTESVHLGMLADPVLRKDVAGVAAKMYGTEGDAPELEERFTVLLAQPFWPREIDHTASAYAALKNLTSWLIGRFCLAAEDATRAAYGPGPLTRYEADLIVPRHIRQEVSLLKAVTAHYVWISYEANRARQREVIAELAEAVAAGAPDTLDPLYRWAYADAADAAARRRVVVDQIASLTDTSALVWHTRLCH